MGGRGSSSKRTGYTTPLMMPPKEAEPEEAKPTEPEATEPDEADKRTYHYFYDKPSGGWTYEGDGHHQVEWFKRNTNADDLISSVDEKTKRAFLNWSSGFFMSGQQYDGWDRMSLQDKEFTQRFDDVLDRSEIKKGVTVVRKTDMQLILGKGVKKGSLADLRAMEGKDVISAGSMSTGAAAQGLNISSSGSHKPLEVRIHIPAGSKGAGMWIGDSRINHWGPEQREFMTNRDSVYTVGKTTYDKDRKVYITDIYFKGRMPHDYGTSGRLSL